MPNVQQQVIETPSPNQASYFGGRLPPRREPRILAVVVVRDAIVYAVLDPYEVRALRTIAGVHGDARDRALRALLVSEKPTAVVIPHGAGRTLQALVDAACARGLPVKRARLIVARTFAAQGRAVRELYPASTRFFELASMHRTQTDVLSLALYALLHFTFLPRRYAPRRNHQ